MVNQNVWCVFEKQKRSCDVNYSYDGTVYLCDGDEVGQDWDTIQIMEYVEKTYDKETVEQIKRELNSYFANSESDYVYVINKITGSFDSYDFQIVYCLNAIFDTEEQANEYCKLIDKKGEKYHYERREMRCK